MRTFWHRTSCCRSRPESTVAEDKKDIARRQTREELASHRNDQAVRRQDVLDKLGGNLHRSGVMVKEGVIVAKNTEPLKFSTYLLTKREEVYRLPAHGRGETGHVGNATPASPLGRDLSQGRRPRSPNPRRTAPIVHVQGPPGHVPVRVGHVRPLFKRSAACRWTVPRRRRSASSTTGTTSKFWRRATASVSRSTARPVVDWRDTGTGPHQGSADRPATRALELGTAGEFSSRGWCWRRSPKKTELLTVK